MQVGARAQHGCNNTACTAQHAQHDRRLVAFARTPHLTSAFAAFRQWNGSSSCCASQLSVLASVRRRLPLPCQHSYECTCCLPACLAACLQISPTEDEQRALQRYRGPREELSQPEQFLMLMCDVPRLDRKVRQLAALFACVAGLACSTCTACLLSGHAACGPLAKLRAGGAGPSLKKLRPPILNCRTCCLAACGVLQIGALIFRQQFQGLCGDAHSGMVTLQQACEQIKSSKRLQQVRLVVDGVITVAPLGRCLAGRVAEWDVGPMQGTFLEQRSSCCTRYCLLRCLGEWLGWRGLTAALATLGSMINSTAPAASRISAHQLLMNG